MGQNRLNSLAIVCIERSYDNKVIVNSMDKIFTVPFDVKVVNVFVFHAMWVCFVSQFEQSRNRTLCKLFGPEGHPPPSPKSEGARTPVIIMN